MKNLTTFVCNLLSAGSQLGDTSVSADRIVEHISQHLLNNLPEDCDVNLATVATHIRNCRSAMQGANFGIDNVTEFHGKYTVKLSNGRSVTFNSVDVTHY